MQHSAIRQEPPPVSLWLQSGFRSFIRGYLRRHFHSIAVVDNDVWNFVFPEDQPLIFYCNHPSWWDPLLVHFFNETRFPKRQFYAPIDADALEQYQVFKKLGFYGVSLNSLRGASVFLEQSRAIISASNTVLWITPEGRFSDVRDRSAPFMPGLAHLCSGLDHGFVVPMSLEYAFWEERLPEVLCKMGAFIDVAKSGQMTKSEWQIRLTGELRKTQADLAALVISRDSKPFRNLLSGKKGSGPMYDTMRRIRALLAGKRLKASHGKQFE
ncbi:hypothetical protein Q31b_56440 [Novipirellula aureliae]|uniref:Phospholipid/glycerol acyltransferase domain-containing protein n=1 Tax=Novipirellula aureliae TaxID=2527966 RepID=A0A5C6DAJ2_9BACT|nr:lysophospholipid acyltransferase family protein [Novipirellula aureliae]TWU34173.1 hypothetical protein Q31b_56440 [Novipirellula aureliae]